MTFPCESTLQMASCLFNMPMKSTMNGLATKRSTKLKMPTGDHEHLNRVDDQNVIDMEPGMAVIEGQETVYWQLCTQVIIFSAEHLFTHASTDLRLEMEDCPEAEVTPFATLIVFRMLDTAASTKGIHTRKNVLV